MDVRRHLQRVVNSSDRIHALISRLQVRAVRLKSR